MLQIKVERAEGVKCPRCWKYQGIPENYQGICDACVQTILETDPKDLLTNKGEKQTDEDFITCFQGLQRDVRECCRKQVEHYLRSNEV
jgi:hypothetical protein